MRWSMYGERMILVDRGCVEIEKKGCTAIILQFAGV